MNHEVERFEGELRQLREIHEKFLNIYKHANAEKYAGVYFICGEAGEKDSMGLPEKILVCPAFGLDGIAVYTKTSEYSAPGY
jgi:hypothetical protein